MNVLWTALGVIAGVGIGVAFFVFVIVAIIEERVWLVQSPIRVKIKTDYAGRIEVRIKNRDSASTFKTVAPTSATFDNDLREAISDARLAACAMRDADRYARRRLPA